MNKSSNTDELLRTFFDEILQASSKIDENLIRTSSKADENFLKTSSKLMRCDEMIFDEVLDPLQFN
jgi:hypothetical protein